MDSGPRKKPRIPPEWPPGMLASRVYSRVHSSAVLAHSSAIRPAQKRSFGKRGCGVTDSSTPASARDPRARLRSACSRPTSGSHDTDAPSVSSSTSDSQAPGRPSRLSTAPPSPDVVNPGSLR